MNIKDWDALATLAKEYRKVVDLIEKGKAGFSINYLNGKVYDSITVNGSWGIDTVHADQAACVQSIRHVLSIYQKSLEDKMRALGVSI